MKARTVHIVTLSTPALTILNEPHPLTGRGRYLFPSIRTAEKPISNNTPERCIAPARAIQPTR
jgi:integrase